MRNPEKRDQPQLLWTRVLNITLENDIRLITMNFQRDFKYLLQACFRSDKIIDIWSSIIYNKNNNCLLINHLVIAKPCRRRMCYISLQFFFLATASHPTERVTQFRWFVDHDLKFSILNRDHNSFEPGTKYFFLQQTWTGENTVFFLWLTLERVRLYGNISW